MKEFEKKKILIILTVAVMLVIAILTVGLVVSGVLNGGSAKENFDDYFDFNNHVAEITLEYEDSNGYVAENDVPDAVQTVGNYAKELYDDKKIKDYQVDDGKSVWVRFNGGAEYIYSPPVAETYPELEQKETDVKPSEKSDSLAISTYQPCMSQFPSELETWEIECVDGAASEVASKLSDEYSFENNYDDDDVSFDVLKNLGTDKLVIWQGHGGYNTKSHSFLQTGVKPDELEYSRDPEGYIEKMGYSDDFANGRIVFTNSGYAAVTYKFFEKYLNSVNAVVIYLGTCHSGDDDVLANTFINKGAKAVVANTGEIRTVCDLKNISYVFDELTTALNGQYQNIKTALEKAKSSNKGLHESADCAADTKIFGDENTRLSDKTVPVTTESTTAQPTTEQPTTEQPTTEQPTTEQPTTEQPTTQPIKKDVSEELFSQLSGKNFLCAPGGGGYLQETLDLSNGGSFTGSFHEYCIGEGAEDGCQATVYMSSFSGQFYDVQKIDDYTYTMKLKTLTLDTPIDTVEIDSDAKMKYVYTDAYGVSGSEIFYVYLPGKSISELSLDVTSYLDGETGTLTKYCIYNKFSSQAGASACGGVFVSTE